MTEFPIFSLTVNDLKGKTQVTIATDQIVGFRRDKNMAPPRSGNTGHAEFKYRFLYVGGEIEISPTTYEELTTAGWFRRNEVKPDS